jgi:hypothetical protein
MQLVLDVESTLPYMSRSAHSALELRRAEATTPASQHLQAAPAERFPENHDTVQQAACQVVRPVITVQTLKLKRT